MSVYAYNNIIKMERTAQETCSVGAAVGDAITIPTIVVATRVYRPIGFAIVDASADFDLLTGTAAGLGGVNSIVAADLSAINQLSVSLGPDDIVVLSDGAGTATVDIRWFWPNKAANGIGVGTFTDVVIPTETMAVTAVTAEALLPIPTGAVELVITDLSADGLLYRVDDPADLNIGSALLQDFLRFENASGSTVDIVSDAADLPIRSAGDYMYVADFSVSGNNGLYRVDVVNSIRANYTCTKLKGTPVNAPNEASTVTVYLVFDGQQVTVLNAHVTYDRPYTISINDCDRLRIQRSAASDVDITGYWRIG